MAYGFNTRALQIPHDQLTGAVVPPVFQTSTYAQDAVGITRGGYEYSRVGNPTRTMLQDQLAALENAEHAYAFPSGLSATDVLLRATVGAGGMVLLPNDVYGGTFRLIDKVYADAGIGHAIVDYADLAAVRDIFAAAPRASVAWVETPTNPLMRVADIAAVSALGAEYGVAVLVDSTMASPYLQQPLALGATAVLHSSTKYLAGHSDVLGGVVATNDDDLGERLGFLANAVGAAPGPMDTWLISRGAKTLGVRMDRHCANAAAVAALLADHPGVASVHYLGLPTDPGHQLAAQQMRNFGAIVSFRPRGGPSAAAQIAKSMRLFTLAESLGGVESLVCVPAQMTHASTQGTPLAPAPDLIRLSVGIEDVEDLLDDLGQVLS